MGIIRFNNVGIKGLSVSVPHNAVKNIDQVGFFKKSELEEFIKKTGIVERRIAPDGMCSSDLCEHAANRLIEDMGIDRNKIDALVFLSQTPDYRVPATSILLQDRLHLSKDTMAFDMNLACSGYIYGLAMCYALVSRPDINNVLFLLGETMSKIVSKTDRGTALLLGDAGSATLITKDSTCGDSVFALETDGSNFDATHILYGGYRHMSSVEGLKCKTYEDGSMRNGEQAMMNGMDVFSFAISALPKNIKKLLEACDLDIKDIDKFIFHQSNQFMMDIIAKKVRLDPNKVLYSISKFGNTSGCSIPLTFADKRELLSSNDRLLLNAIGAGLSYCSAILHLPSHCNILSIGEL